MRDTKNSNKNFQVKTNSKFQKNILADISIDKQSKKSKNQKSQKSIKKERKKERKKEKIERKMKEIFENNTSFNKENAQSKDLLMNNILKNEKFLVNKEIKLQKTDEKNSASETELKRLTKKKSI